MLKSELLAARGRRLPHSPEAVPDRGSFMDHMTEDMLPRVLDRLAQAGSVT
jgi:hypothetical protein